MHVSPRNPTKSPGIQGHSKQTRTTLPQTSANSMNDQAVTVPDADKNANGEVGALERKARLSLDGEDTQEDVSGPSVRKRKVEVPVTGAGKKETAAASVVKDWAKDYCENVIGCTTHNPWDADSDDQSELGSDSEASEGDAADVENGEGGTEESPQAVLRKAGDGALVNSKFDGEGEDELEAHRLPIDSRVSSRSPAPATRKAQGASADEDILGARKCSAGEEEDGGR